MTRKKIALLIGMVILAVIAVAAVYVMRNINEKPPVEVAQTDNAPLTKSSEEEIPSPIIVSSAVFNGVDAVHWGRGSAQIVKDGDVAKLSFGEDFEVAQGPDLFVYLSPNAAGEELGEYASLGSLKANSGVQEYTLPENYEDYKTVVVWCRAVGVTFATAELK
jgi:hypothetical protein